MNHQQPLPYIADQMAAFSDILSIVPRVTRGAYVDTLLLQQRAGPTSHSTNLGFSAQTSSREFSMRNRSCINSLHESSGLHTSLDSSFGHHQGGVRPPAVSRETGDAMLRRQRALERAALKRANVPAATSWKQITAPADARRAF